MKIFFPNRLPRCSGQGFTKAAIEQQLKNIDKQFEQLMEVGIPEDMRAYLGMVV